MVIANRAALDRSEVWLPTGERVLLVPDGDSVRLDTPTECRNCGHYDGARRG